MVGAAARDCLPELECGSLRFSLGWRNQGFDHDKVAYEVTPSGDQWLVTRDGQPGMSYVSQEAAYRWLASRRPATFVSVTGFVSKWLGTPIVVRVTALGCRSPGPLSE